MFAVYLILILQTLVTPSDQKFRADVNYQVDRHLQRIISDSQTDANYWYLVQLAQSIDWAGDVINARILQLSNQNLSETTSCLFKAFQNVESGASFDKNIQRLVNGNLCLQEDDLLISALYEFDVANRSEFASGFRVQLNQIRSEDELLNEYINKALGTEVDTEILFKPRQIRLIDHYLFNSYQANPSSAGPHRELIDIWQNSISEKSRLIEASDFIKVQVLVTAYHTLDRNFSLVFDLLPLVKNNRNHPNSISKHVMFKRVVFAASAFGYYQTALNFYREDLLPLSHSIMDSGEYLTVQMDYSTIMFRLGNVRGALSNFQIIYQDIDLITDLRYKSSLLNNLAVSYLNAGFFDQYLNLQLEAYELAVEMNSYSFQLQILNNLFVYYKANSDWSRASFYIEKAIEIAQLENRTSEIANINILLATYYRDVDKDYKRAVDQLNDVISQLNPGDNYIEYVFALSELSNTYLNMHEYTLFERSRLQLLEVAKSRNDTQVAMETYSALADHYFRTNRIEEALDMVDVIQKIEIEDFEFRLRVQVTNTIANMLINSGRTNDAINLLTELADEIISNVRSSSDVQSGTIRLEIGYKQTFMLLADLLIDANRSDTAIKLLDDIKNLSKASYVNSSLLKSSILTEEEFLRDVQLSNQIDQLRTTISRSTSSDKLKLNNELIQLLAEQNLLNNKVLNNYSNSELDIKSLQKFLDRNDQILSYSAIDSVMYLTSITKYSVDIHRFILSDESLNIALESINEIKNIAPDLTKLYRLYRELLQNYISDDSKRLIIVPDAFWYQIPIEILPTTPGNGAFSYGSVKYLIENYSISYSNSLSDISNDFQTKSRSYPFKIDYLGIGVSNFNNTNNIEGSISYSPLPYAKVEINNAFDIISDPSRSLILLDSDARKSSLLQKADQSRIIHIASHSEVYTNDPLFSIIQLNPDSGNDSLHDGKVYAYELFDLDLRSELLVLSSCDSGGGTYIEGSGIIGLGRALKFAGAQSLILNTWAIQDRAASDLMTEFFKSIMQGDKKDVALRNSKVKFINEINSNPAVWGSLILYGNNAPIVKNNYLLHIILIMAGIIALFIIYRKYFR
jgi:CHAT domain-containing protein